MTNSGFPAAENVLYEGMARRHLRFYRTYPNIVGALSPQFRSLLPKGVSLEERKAGTPSPQSSASAETLLNRLSYSPLRAIATGPVLVGA